MNKNAVPFVDMVGHFIGGRVFRDPQAKLLDIYNPATGVVTRKVAEGTDTEVNAAVNAAMSAAESWAETPPLARARILFRYRDLLERHVDELAHLVTLEHGKILSDAKGEVLRGLEVVEFACGIPHLLKGEHAEQVGRGIDSWSLRQPLGVVAGITPFNFPVMVPMWLFPIAIACGNTFILKPSERDPSPSIRLAELFSKAGLPDGVFNVVQGGKKAVDAVLLHPDIAAVSFVGSTPVAEHIYRSATLTGKRVQALGGAKNHMVILPDADLDRTIDALMGAAFGSAGERCMAVSVAVIVGDDWADAVVKRLAQRIRGLRVGPGTDRNAEMGPLVTRQHLERVQDYVDVGVKEGAELVVDGRCPDTEETGGFFLRGCLFDRVTPEMRIYREEIFGPVLAVMRAPSLEAAIDIVNQHEFGNGVAVFTRDGDAARTFAHRIKVGMVGINVPIPVPSAFHSFGGWKRSLFGDVAVHGPEGVRFYTRLKTISSRWPSEVKQGSEFNMPTS